MLLLNSLRIHSTKLAFSCERSCFTINKSITTSSSSNLVQLGRNNNNSRKSVIDKFSINSSRQYKSVGSFAHQRKLLLVVGTSSRRSMSTSAVNMKLLKQYDNIVKSGQDGRLYRGLLLDNGLKCLIVSDPSTDRSAASLDVNAGYLLDPPKFPGLAHFLEHMLFMGSKKYPTENTFAKFIDDHAGMTNAYTSTENTNYHFEVATTHFKEALDIFAQFFISPLFDPSSTERELNAVDSENQKNLQSDAWRIDQLEKSTCVPEHPYSKFGTGNLSTLKIEPEKEGLNVREELLKFHSNYYSANLMTLCLLGKENLDELQQYVVEMFSDIPNKNLSPSQFDPYPFGKDFTSTIKHVVPVKDLKSMSLTWSTPDYRDHYKTNPGSYLSHLIGHEGKGSLLSELKKRGWVNSLYAGPRREGRGFQFFNLVLDLSDEGEENIDNIVKLIYQYLNMLQSQTPAQWVFDEVSNLGKIGFEFKDKETPTRLVSSLSADLHTYTFEDVLSAPYYATKFDPELIHSLGSYLKPDKMRITLISKKYEGKTDKKEKWYGTDYAEAKMSESQINELNTIGVSDAFSLPPKNAYVPEDLKLVEHEDGTANLPAPKVIHSTQLARLWFKDDSQFKLPKAIIKLEMRNPLINLDPLHYNMASMFEQLLLDSLNEHLYSAELAGLHYKIDTNNYGFVVTFSGFSDKINVLVETIFDKMTKFQVDPVRFNIIKESHKRELTNFEADQPYRHSMYYMTLLVAEKGWSKAQLLNSLDDFTVEDLQAFIPKVLTKGMFIESIAYGNITQKRAIEMLDLVESKLKSINSHVKPLEKYHQKNLRQYELKPGSSFIFMKNNNVHKTTSIEIYYQCGVQSNRNNALVQLFCQVINESAFNVLRTKEQLGYIVASGVRNFGGAQGCKVIIQSDRTPAYLDERVENFLALTKESLTNMSDEEFKQHVDALILNKLEEPKKMSRQMDIYWSEIASHQYHFEREKIEVEEIKKLTKSDLIEFMQNHIEESDKRRKLAVYVHPAEMNDQMSKDGLKAQLIDDMHDWQNQLSLFPLVKPYTNV